MRPAWLEIDLNVVRHNLSCIRGLVGPDVGVIAVVKANAYGHGALPVARCVIEGGARMLAVALMQEAVELREGGLTAPILVLGATDPEEAPEFIAHDVIPAVSHFAFAGALARAAAEHDTVAACHVKIDSGMGRQGTRLEDVAELASRLRELPAVRVEGALSHFASSPGDREFTLAQVRRFLAGVADLERGLGHEVPLRHLANSAAILRYPEAWLDAVRPGALMYGIAAPGGGEHLPATGQAMTLKARIVALKALRAGESVGYGRTFIAPRDTRIAVLPIGYADGYPRALSGKAEALVRGQRCRVAGRVSMDCIVIDVGGAPGVEAGEEVVLLGRQGDEMITTAELARLADTCVEEIVARMSARLPRVFLGEGGTGARETP